MRKFWTTFGAVFFITFCLFSFNSVASEGWWFRAGTIYRGDMSVTIKGSSYVQSLGLHATATYRKDPSGIGTETSNANRDYENGTVYEDVASADQLTWFWAWEDAEQWDAASQSLSFTKGGGIAYHQDTLLDIALQGHDDVDAGGLSFTAGRPLPTPERMKNTRIRFDLVFGVQGIWNADSRMKGTTYRECITRETYKIVDTYDVGYDLTASGAFPPPYEGNYFGPGPIIPNHPTDRNRVVTSRKSWEAENRVSMRIRSGLLEVSAGPKATIDVTDKIAVYLIPSLSATFVDLDIERDEQFAALFPDGSTQTLQTWNDETSEREWLLGVGIQLGADVAISEDWFAGLYIGYDWTDKAEVGIGPNKVALDPTGFTIGGELGRKL